MISETEFYSEIFEDFIDLDNIHQENELWKSNSIIKGDSDEKERSYYQANADFE